MNKNWMYCLCFVSVFAMANLETVYEKSGGTASAAYDEGMAFYRELARTYANVTMRAMGPTDSGEPLHLVLFSADGNFDISGLKRQGKRFLMINNAIHAGEPDGVDASMMFLRDLASGKTRKDHLERVVIGIVPYYNIGGALNRNSTTRVNQVGPEAYGFRGNARNFDLNRDFIKNDSLNARSFAEIYHLLDPEVYLETHVTNGSDHQYVLTLISTQSDKLGGSLGAYLKGSFEPDLMKRIADKEVMATPYVNVFGSTPDQGIPQFLDGPRYSTGYTALFQTIGFMTETHSLKPFKQRVHATRAFIECLVDSVIARSVELRDVRKKSREELGRQNEFALSWELDRSSWDTLRFHGYEPERRNSEVTPGQRLFYNRERPFVRDVPFYNKYIAKQRVSRPHAYVIPRGWHPIVALLKRNGIELQPLPSDREMQVEVYHIDSYETRTRPYEGHYQHYDTKVRKSMAKIAFRKGDWVIPTAQNGARYLLETLEPMAPDSFFNWNYFDTILQQKEYFSSYIFEDIAKKMLRENADLKKAFEKRKAEDQEFAKNRRSQLGWIYSRSPHYESAHLRYPVYRLLNP